MGFGGGAVSSASPNIIIDHWLLREMLQFSAQMGFAQGLRELNAG